MCLGGAFSRKGGDVVVVLTVDRDRLAQEYAAALRDFLHDAGEGALAIAYELGRRATASNIGVVELVTIHEESLREIDVSRRGDATQFLLEALSPFEMSHRGFRDACDRLQVMNRELETANRDLEAFSYSASHDLRAPLRAISGFAMALEQDLADKLDPAAMRHLRRIQSATLRMDDLIGALLKLAGLARSVIDRRAVDVSELARAVARDLHAQDPARPITITIEPDMVADADRSLLRVVLENLLGNAWKFTTRQSAAQIQVGSIVVGGELAYYVRDNGVGFDASGASRLFSPFQRFHSEAEFRGTGIGLATVARVIDRHGGRIWAESAAGAGATFFFTIPDRSDGTQQLPIRRPAH